MIAVGSLVLLFKSSLSAYLQRVKADHQKLFFFGLPLVAAYNGYFGAGSGIMMLALIVLTVESDLVRANAYKNVLLAAGELVVAVGFITFGPVPWAATIPLAIGFFFGGLMGPSLVRRAPSEKLQSLIAIAGLSLAAWLLVVAVRN